MHQFANSQPKIKFSDLNYPDQQVRETKQTKQLNLTSNELSRLRSTSLIQDDKLQQQQRLNLKEQRLLEIQSKKEQMEQIRKERNDTAPNMNKRQTQNSSIQRAKEIMNEGLDEVKRFNTIANQAKVNRIRELQKIENNQIFDNFKDTEKKLEYQCEIERMKKVYLEQEKEQIQKEKQMKGREVLIQQIKQRDVRRMKQQEVIEQEKILLNNRLIKEQEQEDKIIEEQKARAKILAQHIQEDNKKQQLIKQMIIQQDKLEDQKIQAYQMERIRQKELEEQELKRKRDRMEKELQKKRELQEKQADRQAEQDESKAQKAYFEKEKKHKQKQIKDQEILEEKINHLIEVRDKQYQNIQQEKQKLIQEDKNEQKQLVQTFKHSIEVENENQRQKRLNRIQHQEQIREQMRIKEEKKQLEKELYHKERTQLEQDRQNYTSILDNIKNNKIQNLSDAYQREMRKIRT